MKSFMRSLGRQEQIGKYMKLLVYFCSLFDLWNNLLFSTGRVSLQSHYSDDIAVDVEGNLRLNNRRRLWTEELMKNGAQLNLHVSRIFYDPTVNQSSSPMVVVK